MKDCYRLEIFKTGSFTNENGDGNENDQKAIALSYGYAHAVLGSLSCRHIKLSSMKTYPICDSPCTLQIGAVQLLSVTPGNCAEIAVVIRGTQRQFSPNTLKTRF